MVASTDADLYRLWGTEAIRCLHRQQGHAVATAALQAMPRSVSIATAGHPPRAEKPHAPPGMRICAACGLVKPLNDFTPTKARGTARRPAGRAELPQRRPPTFTGLAARGRVSCLPNAPAPSAGLQSQSTSTCASRRRRPAFTAAVVSVATLERMRAITPPQRFARLTSLEQRGTDGPGDYGAGCR